MSKLFDGCPEGRVLDKALAEEIIKLGRPARHSILMRFNQPNNISRVSSYIKTAHHRKPKTYIPHPTPYFCYANAKCNLAAVLRAGDLAVHAPEPRGTHHSLGLRSVGGGTRGIRKSTRMGCRLASGGLSSASSINVIPSDQTSAWGRKGLI